MPWFFHPDIKSQYFHFQFLSQGVINIYDHIDNNKNQLPYHDTFNYPPLAYYTFGLINITLKPFLPADFSQWINDWGMNQNNYSHLPIFMFVLKLPYLVLDVLMAVVLLKIFKDERVFKFWLFNPISIYLIYILGNFDILPTFLSLLAFLFLSQERDFWAFFTLGLSIALKAYAFIFVPFFLFYRRFSVKNIFYLSIPILVTILPFIFQPVFLNSFMGSGLTQKILENKIFNLPVFPLIYFFIFIQYFCAKNKPKAFLKSILYTFLFFFALVKFHPQWLIWFFPFLIPSIIANQKKLFLFIVYLIFVFVYISLINDSYLTWGHLIPINPAIVNLTTPYNFIKNRFMVNPAIIQNIIKNILFILAFFHLAFYEKKE
ncbi:MAG TPA: glycosyltransferase 87 family protein [Candidatus Woesebacteria bacterium]|nr:glycosyltransferase 87 family protein [Candidatus Woesebacteria bacterium]